MLKNIVVFQPTLPELKTLLSQVIAHQDQPIHNNSPERYTIVREMMRLGLAREEVAFQGACYPEVIASLRQRMARL